MSKLLFNSTQNYEGNILNNAPVYLELSANSFLEVAEILIQQNVPFSTHYKMAESSKEEINLASTYSDEAVNDQNDIYSYKNADLSPTIMTNESIDKIIDDALHKGEVLSNETFASKFGLSRQACIRKFLLIKEQSFWQYYIQKRMELASTLLKQGYKSNEVSTLTGYGSKSAIKFNKMFQKHFGMTPKQYQTEHFGKINRRVSPRK